jgi:hypothetical protein
MDEAHPEPDKALSWLRDRLTPDTDTWRHVVTEVVPAGFPAYVRVFHSWSVDGNPEQRSTWREMAEIADAHYHGELTSSPLEPALQTAPAASRWVVDEGEPDPQTRHGLVQVLTGVTSPGQPVYFSYELARVVRGQTPIVWKSSLTSLEPVRAHMGDGFVGPEHWWPEDRSWVVGSDYDLCSTYIACSEDLSLRLTSSDQIEAIMVGPDARVDNAADNINARK